GINLLNSDNLITNFSRDGSSNLVTQGVDFTSSGIGFSTLDYTSFANIDSSLNELEIAQSQVQDFSRGLFDDLNIIETRQSFTENTITNLEAGQSDLLSADQEEEAASVLALQTQQNLQITTLALSTQGTNIGDLLAQQNPLLINN
ncbi:MAG: hypothetical protein AAGB32_00755, partial [Pseudomonadota bacterium]